MVEVVTAGSMETAVDLAARLADGHGEVVLSPGCASFDWYPSGGYPARVITHPSCERAHEPRSF